MSERSATREVGSEAVHRIRPRLCTPMRRSPSSSPRPVPTSLALGASLGSEHAAPEPASTCGVIGLGIDQRGRHGLLDLGVRLYDPSEILAMWEGALAGADQLLEQGSSRDQLVSNIEGYLRDRGRLEGAVIEWSREVERDRLPLKEV